MARIGLLLFRGDDEERGLLASGELEGSTWQLGHHEQFGSEGPVLVFTATAGVGGAAGLSCFGKVRMHGARSLLVGTSAVGHHRFVWGLAPRDAAVATVIDEAGASHESPVGGTPVGRLEPFVVVLDAMAIPAEVHVLGRGGDAIGAQSLRPPPPADTGLAARVETHALAAPVARRGGTVLAEGRVDDHVWSFTADRRGDDLIVGTRVEGPRGGGSSSGTGSVPRPTRACRFGISGTGGSNHCWHLDGWADPAVHRVVLHLRSGDTLDLPVVGRERELGIGLFVIALPYDADGHTLEAFDAGGTLIDRCWLPSSLTDHDRNGPIGA